MHQRFWRQDWLQEQRCPVHQRWRLLVWILLRNRRKWLDTVGILRPELLQVVLYHSDANHVPHTLPDNRTVPLQGLLHPKLLQQLARQMPQGPS